MSDCETAPKEAGESSKLLDESAGIDTVQQVFSMLKSYLEQKFDMKVSKPKPWTRCSSTKTRRTRQEANSKKTSGSK